MDAEYTPILQWEEATKYQVGDYITPLGKWAKDRYLFRIKEIVVYSIGIQHGPNDEIDVHPALTYAFVLELVWSHDGTKIWNWMQPKAVKPANMTKEVVDILYK